MNPDLEGDYREGIVRGYSGAVFKRLEGGLNDPQGSAKHMLWKAMKKIPRPLNPQ